MFKHVRENQSPRRTRGTFMYTLVSLNEERKKPQIASVNQIVVLHGCYYREEKLVIISFESGVYKAINVETFDYETIDVLFPLKQKHGIGHYVDTENPEFLTDEEVSELKDKAYQKLIADNIAEEEKRIETEKIKAIGRDRLQNLIKPEYKAVIVAYLREDDSDTQVDHWGYNTIRTVILGFSQSTRQNFNELRKFAKNFEETHHLTEYNEDWENREAYYYLGQSKYSGWIIQKQTMYNTDTFLNDFSYTAGFEENLQLGKQNVTVEKFEDPHPVSLDNLEIVDYSDKAIALFGDTKPIKDLLKDLGGRFNPALNLNGEKCPGWVFPKSKKGALTAALNIQEEPVPIPKPDTEPTPQDECTHKIQMVMISHLSDVQHLMSFNIEEANTRLNLVKTLLMKYTDTTQEVGESTLNGIYNNLK